MVMVVASSHSRGGFHTIGLATEEDVQTTEKGDGRHASYVRRL